MLGKLVTSSALKIYNKKRHIKMMKRKSVKLIMIVYSVVLFIHSSKDFFEIRIIFPIRIILKFPCFTLEKLTFFVVREKTLQLFCQLDEQAFVKFFANIPGFSN